MSKNFVSNKDESVPLFSNRYIDFLSRVHYSVPLILYVPLVLFFLYQSAFVYQLHPLVIVGLVTLGLIIWTFVEYNMHRFVFHWTPPGKWGKQINFIFHGVHHDYPKDSMRLVMVPIVSIPLCVFFYSLFYLLLGTEKVAPFFSGFVTGYLFYDMSHFALHHANFRSKFWMDLKQHHMNHHYSDPENGYGVSTKFWDLVYRSTFKKKTGGRIIVEERIKTPELEQQV